jgi:hypothetical protein
MSAYQPITKLNEAQLMLLKLLNVGLNEQQIEDIRTMLLSYLEKTLFEELDIVVQEKGYTNVDFENMLNQSQRTKPSL